MPPTKRICLTALEVTKNVCFNMPTMEGVKLSLARLHREVVLKHPYASAAAFLFLALYPQFPFHALYFVFWVIPHSIVLGFLTCLGFEREGVRTGSMASRYQARRYGSYTPANGVFSGAQSYGAIHHEPSTSGSQPSHPVAKAFWRTMTLLCIYASLVILLKELGK